MKLKLETGTKLDQLLGSIPLDSGIEESEIKDKWTGAAFDAGDSSVGAARGIDGQNLSSHHHHTYAHPSPGAGDNSKKLAGNKIDEADEKPEPRSKATTYSLNLHAVSGHNSGGESPAGLESPGQTLSHERQSRETTRGSKR